MDYNIIFLKNVREYLILNDDEYEEFEINYNAENLVQRNMSLVDAVKLKKVLDSLLWEF